MSLGHGEIRFAPIPRRRLLGWGLGLLLWGACAPGPSPEAFPERAEPIARALLSTLPPDAILVGEDPTLRAALEEAVEGQRDARRLISASPTEASQALGLTVNAGQDPWGELVSRTDRPVYSLEVPVSLEARAFTEGLGWRVFRDTPAVQEQLASDRAAWSQLGRGPDAPPESARLWLLAECRAALHRGDTQASLPRLETSIQEHPDPDWLAEVGAAVAAVGRAPESLHFLTRALTLAPDHARARFHRCRVYQQLGRSAEALADLTDGAQALERLGPWVVRDLRAWLQRPPARADLRPVEAPSRSSTRS